MNQERKIKIAITDDNPIDIEYITVIVKKWALSRNVDVHIKAFSSAEAFHFEYCEDKAWDILLLDIEMNGKNGIELAKVIRENDKNMQIVFVTGFPDFMAAGYDVSALHYLLKPVSEEKLHEVLDRAVANLVKCERQLRITFDRQISYVPLRQICYIEAQKQYVVIHTENEIYRMKSTLTDIEKQLDEYFLKCQRSFLINLRYVKRIMSDCVILKNEEKIPISRGMAEKIGKEIIRLF